MRSIKEIMYQLDQIGVRNKFLVWPEIRQLPGVLFDDEVIQRFVIGGYPTGFAIMVATNKRVLIVQKIFLGLVVEDIPYSSVHAIKFNNKLVFGDIDINLMDKTITMRRISRNQVHNFVKFVQYKMQEVMAINRQAMQTEERRVRPRRIGSQLLDLDGEGFLDFPRTSLLVQRQQAFDTEQASASSQTGPY